MARGQPSSPLRWFLAGAACTGFLICMCYPFLLIDSCGTKLAAGDKRLDAQAGGRHAVVLPRKALQREGDASVAVSGSSRNTSISTAEGSNDDQTKGAAAGARAARLPLPQGGSGVRSSGGGVSSGKEARVASAASGLPQQNVSVALRVATDAKLAYRIPAVVQRFREGGLVWDAFAYGKEDPEAGRYFTGTVFQEHDYGPLTDYTVCKVLRVKCAIHSGDRTACLRDGFCGWCKDKQVCVDRHLLHEDDFCADDKFEVAPQPSGPPEHAVMIEGQHAVGVTSLDGCTSVVQGHFNVPSMSNEQMYYHWLFDNWPSLAMSDNRLQHFIIHEYRADLFHYFGLLSDNCWRFARDLPEGLCIATWPTTPSLPNPPSPDADSFRVAAFRMGFPSAGPHAVAPTKPRVLLIQRSVKRFILNVDELAEASRAMGLETVVAFLDELTFYEQLSLLSTSTVLVGLHGSGIANFVFLPKGAAVLEVYQLKSGQHAGMYYAGRVPGAGMAYGTLQITNQADCVFHWKHYKPDVKTAAQKQQVIDNGPQGNVDFWTFWVNMDARIRVPEFKLALKDLVNRAPIHQDMGFRIP